MRISFTLFLFASVAFVGAAPLPEANSIGFSSREKAKVDDANSSNTAPPWRRIATSTTTIKPRGISNPIPTVAGGSADAPGWRGNGPISVSQA
uniref:Uncharacterized protein n=1 Tax=Mycena chlorophos TaxID=658473 RepID=A0ABQ0LZ35_MYCCL|nr:predicted protein [Mycena chlorophos]